ncbi:MAG: alpha/beta hydrolase [Gammaproteobacteria bacterium]|nr:alpha/beta hydrolase [Gammaproteobacteria bacterium]
MNLKSIIRFSFILLACLLSGCTHLFFQPQKELITDPGQFRIDYQDLHVQSTDNVQLHGWLLSPQKEIVGTIIFYHGNAENISTHFRNVVWLLNEGYQVVAFDYQGYGHSEGVPYVEGALNDILTTSQFVVNNLAKDKPIFVFGQSLGAALSITAFANAPELSQRIKGFIFEASFASYQQIAQEQLAKFWLTWPLQYPLSWFASSDYDPEKHIANIKQPILLLHSQNDQVTPFHHAIQLQRKVAHQLEFMTLIEPHIGSSHSTCYRQTIISFLEESTNPNQS